MGQRGQGAPSRGARAPGQQRRHAARRRRPLRHGALRHRRLWAGSPQRRPGGAGPRAGTRAAQLGGRRQALRRGAERRLWTAVHRRARHDARRAADRLRRRLAPGADQQRRRPDRRAALPPGGDGEHGQRHRRPGALAERSPRRGGRAHRPRRRRADHRRGGGPPAGDDQLRGHLWTAAPRTARLPPRRGAGLSAPGPELRGSAAQAREVARAALEGTGAWVVGGTVRDRLLGRPTDDLDLVLAGDLGAAARRLGRAACELGFDAEAASVRAARERAPGLQRVAGERLFFELRRIVVAEAALAGLRLMEEVGATDVVLPELSALHGVEQTRFHHLDVHDHTLAVLGCVIELQGHPAAGVGPQHGGAVAALLDEPLADSLSRGEALRLGALLHDAAKPTTRAVTPEGRVTFLGHDEVGARMAEEVLGRLRSSERLRRHVADLTRHHLRLGFLVHERPLTLRVLHRYLRACDPVEVDVTLFSLADRLATRGANAKPAIAPPTVSTPEDPWATLRCTDMGPT